MRLYGTEGVLSVGRGAIRLHRPDGSTETWTVKQQDAGYYNEFLDFHQALAGETELTVGTIAQSVRNMEIVTTGLESAERGETVAITDGPTQLSATAVPLWKPAGAEGLFDGLGVEIEHDVTPA